MTVIFDFGTWWVEGFHSSFGVAAAGTSVETITLSKGGSYAGSSIHIEGASVALNDAQIMLDNGASAFAIGQVLTAIRAVGTNTNAAVQTISFSILVFMRKTG